MAKKQAVVNPAETISAMRNDALLAYLEWPVFLHIRLKELNDALAITGESQPAPMIPPNLPSVEATPDPAPVVNFVPDLPPAPAPDAVTDFLAQFPDGEGNAA